MQSLGSEGQLLNNGTELDQTGIPIPTGNLDNQGSIFGGFYGGLNDSGQTWMWEMDPFQF